METKLDMEEKVIYEVIASKTVLGDVYQEEPFTKYLAVITSERKSHADKTHFTAFLPNLFHLFSLG